MHFYIFLCSRNPSIAIVLDVKTRVPVRSYQGAELLLWAEEALGSGLVRLLEHQGLCSGRTELADRGLQGEP